VDKIELRECPFCGSMTIPVALSGCSGYLACLGCGFQTQKYWDEPMSGKEPDRKKWYELAEEAWNRRMM